MNRKTVVSMVLGFLLIGTLMVTLNVRTAKGAGTIYIRADGSVDPPTAPIHTADNIEYTLTGNITANADGIGIERDNIVLNGAGYTVKGMGSGTGIMITGYSDDHPTPAKNVVVKNVNVQGFGAGLSFGDYAINNCVVDSNITNNSLGVGYGAGSVNDNVTGNSITWNGRGVYGMGGDDLTRGYVWENNITANNGTGIYATGRTVNFVIVGNTINDNGGGGIGVGFGAMFDIYGNEIKDNTVYGVAPTDYSSYANIHDNNITGNQYGIINQYDGFSVYGNNIINNLCGVFNDEYGSGKFYHNNFIGNAVQVNQSGTYGPAWDNGYPSGGNYWSDYTGIDAYSGPYQNITGADGFGDTPYNIIADSRDNYPLILPYMFPKEDVIPPFIQNVFRDPSVPNYDENVQVQAVVSDNVGVESAFVFYSYGNSTCNVTMTNYGGNNFTASILPLPYNTTVTYRVCAKDTSNNWAVSNEYYYVVGDFAPPEILSVEWKPACPYPYVSSNLTRANEPTIIMANVSEPLIQSGVAIILLSYRADSGKWWNTTMDYNSTSGLWETTIPAQSNTTNTVGFFIEAHDNAGNVATFAHEFNMTPVLAGDINADGKIDMKDIGFAARHFGEHYP